MIEFISSDSLKNSELFGDDSVVPLLGLLANKSIALDFIDTNNEVFKSGLKNLNATLGRLKGRDILFIIRSNQGISAFKEVKSFLNNNCEFLSNFHDKTEGDYLIYRCK
jgi:hypothetical protein